MTQSSAKLSQEDPVLCAELGTFATVGTLFGAAAAIGARPLLTHLLASFGFVLLYSLTFTSATQCASADIIAVGSDIEEHDDDDGEVHYYSASFDKVSHDKAALLRMSEM